MDAYKDRRGDRNILYNRNHGSVAAQKSCQCFFGIPVRLPESVPECGFRLRIPRLRQSSARSLQVLKYARSKIVDYLDDLIGQNEKVPSVIQSGNEMLDIILNSKLSAAADAGVEVRLTRTHAPRQLPLTDTELCSLIMNIMNIMDNAMEAALAPGIRH